MQNTFSIWVDADSCPTEVRNIIIRFAKRLEIQTTFVANREISIPQNPIFKMIVTEATQDAADNYIVSNADTKDLVITRDIPLADRLVEKDIVTINDRGLVFTRENIKEKLSIRNFNFNLYTNGIISEKTGRFGKKELNDFSNCFDREIQKKLRNI